MTPRRKTLLTILLTLLSAGGVTALVLYTDWGRRQVYNLLKPAHPWPQRDVKRLRHQLMAQRDAALARGDLATAALQNASFAQEALVRADAAQKAWLAVREETKLYAQWWGDQWNYRNTAADFYAFMIHAGMRVNPDSLPHLQETLAAEIALAPAGELCQPVIAATGKKISADDTELMFASTEYVKDGLLSVYERWGHHQPWSKRMFDVTDAILQHSKTQSNFGMLPGQGSEENGNMVQVCARLYFASGDERYADLAGRIADAAVQQMLPASNGLPARQFNYVRNKPSDSRVRIRDHGNEIIPGLTEIYALAVARQSEPSWKARADRWAEPIAKMLETLRDKARDKNGLLMSTVDAYSLKQVDFRMNDNWGYITNGMLLFAQATRRHGLIAEHRLARLEQGVEEIAAAVARQYGVPWEKGHFDGYADTLESAMYAAFHRPATEPTLAPWIDDQIELMFLTQRPDGFISKGYLDGNFMRTALMYADMRSGGFRTVPFHPDVRVGYARKGTDAVVVIAADSSYTGVLVTDRPRHREIMKLPWDWPRLNSWPEWCTTHDLAALTGATGLTPPTLEQLAAGVPLKLNPGDRLELHLKLK
jgi:hypothetical protein